MTRKVILSFLRPGRDAVFCGVILLLYGRQRDINC